MNTSSNRIGGASPQVHFLREGTEFKILRALLKSIVLLPGIALFLSHCSNGDATNLFGDPRDWLLGPYRFSVHYTHPGRDEDTSQDKKIDQKLIELIDEADTSVDMAVYNLSRESVIDALIRAEERGLDVRMVGDVDEVVTDGYRSILRTNIPFSLGNSTAIQHNKFALIDGRYTFMGTGNMTTSGFLRSNNHYLIIENEEMTDYYRREFEQMYYGRYGSRKTPFSTNNNFLVNFTDLQVFYSPYNGDDAMNRIISLVDNAKTDIKYMIFAHTHDELTTAMIRAARRGVLVRGVHDKTFIRGTSEEAPRLYSAGRYMPGGPFPRQDGNEFTAIKGIASHGGKMHCKSMIVDNEWIATGSFNWSTNAVENNDENLVVFRNPFIAQELIQQWQDAWDI
ncbi:MAG: hypothetical protein KDK30_14280, partial [Leptospiraceae bacterium]|nr:hypothetical protein [Leptospiraceae bacterium]